MKRPSTGAWVSIALGTVLALLFLLSRAAAVEAVYPVERAGLSFSRQVWTRIVGFFRGASAEAENVRLRQEIDALKMVRTDFERVENENARLRRTLGYAAQNPEFWMPAAVLSTKGGAIGAHGTIRVDKGALAGVREGAVVAVPDGLVGKVLTVTPHTCEIAPISDPRVKVSCELEVGQANPPRGLLCGNGAACYPVLCHLVRGDRLPAQARVVTSGLGGVFPRGLEIGMCFVVNNHIEVRPSVDFSRLEDVFIRREK